VGFRPSGSSAASRRWTGWGAVGRAFLEAADLRVGRGVASARGCGVVARAGPFFEAADLRVGRAALQIGPRIASCAAASTRSDHREIHP
jgi:hypothetical protein